MNFVKLTKPNGEPVWINADFMVCATGAGFKGKTVIYTLIGTQSVNEEPEDVVKELMSLDTKVDET